MDWQRLVKPNKNPWGKTGLRRALSDQFQACFATDYMGNSVFEFGALDKPVQQLINWARHKKLTTAHIQTFMCVDGYEKFVEGINFLYHRA